MMVSAADYNKMTDRDKLNHVALPDGSYQYDPMLILQDMDEQPVRVRLSEVELDSVEMDADSVYSANWVQFVTTSGDEYEYYFGGEGEEDVTGDLLIAIVEAW